MAWMTRFLGAVVFLAVGVLFSPETFRSKSEKLTSFINLTHLLSFSTAWGAALWVTFIGGIIMFKNLPRHQFGNLQSKMFPAYFSVVSVCCAASVACFGYTHPWKSASTAEKYQLGFLVSAFAFNLTNLFIFTPMTIERKIMFHASQINGFNLSFQVVATLEQWCECGRQGKLVQNIQEGDFLGVLIMGARDVIEDLTLKLKGIREMVDKMKKEKSEKAFSN